MALDLIEIIMSDKREIFKTIMECMVVVSVYDAVKSENGIALKGVHNDAPEDYSAVSRFFLKHAKANVKNEKGLFQYTAALVAAKKANDEYARGACMQSLMSNYPSLPRETIEFFESL